MRGGRSPAPGCWPRSRANNCEKPREGLRESATECAWKGEGPTANPEPAMTDRDLFIAALEHPEDERQAWLDRFCADDPDLRRRLDVLLRAHEMASQFLASPAVEQFADQAAPNGSTHRLDTA